MSTKSMESASTGIVRRDGGGAFDFLVCTHTSESSKDAAHRRAVIRPVSRRPATRVLGTGGLAGVQRAKACLSGLGFSS
jgi:hypothetical protein